MTATATAKARSAGAKTARACDICLRTRARWFCAADDAFLCQKCDSTVHAANSVAHRHERVRLKTPPSVNSRVVSDEEPTWHHGFKRKARTPRGGGGKEERRTCSSGPVVPELGTPSEEEEEEEESSNPSMVVDEGELIYRVPIYDPMLSEFCSPPPPATPNDEVKPEGIVSSGGGLSSEFLTPDTDLREFEIDMERLLGGVLEEESFCMEGLGFHGGGGVEEYYSPAAEEYNPLKEEEEMYVDDSSGLTDVKYDCGSPWTSGRDTGDVADGGGGRQRGVKLKLDYESVISAWSTQGSPWADGERPKLDSGDCFPDFMGMMVWVGGAEFQGGGGMVTGGGGCHGGVTQTHGGDGGREARVSRYREKRRTRLFSKKIRYEVRKLNAEKRPRMKGRFVKRTTSANAVAAKPQFVF